MVINDIPQPVQEEIERRLATIEVEEAACYLLAVESGSRAWGFPSPDSDYDVRFVYVRPRSWYLSLTPGRDVIERPIVDEIDLNGWDLRKFLNLMLKSNAVVSEWLCSPIRYRPDHPVVERITQLAQRHFNPRAVAHHYASAGFNTSARWLNGDETPPVKRYFYALRPALAIRALRIDPTRPPPMNLQALVTASDLPSGITGLITELVEAKSKTREQGNARRFPELDTLIATELDRAHELPIRRSSRDTVQAANQLFLESLES
jgi:predicted nucleotidyltransferase